MEVSKIRLSQAELNLVCDADIILTKNTIIRKTINMLESVQEAALYSTEQAQRKGRGVFSVPPKISKGENYLGLPYVVLDYPRWSDSGNLLFVRNMFWWGNYFSTTLQASGQFVERLLGIILEAYPVLKAEGYFAGINSDPWQHHFGEDNYVKIGTLSESGFSALLEEQDQIKIAAPWPLQDWNLAATRMYESWKLFFELITKAV